jgi:hypothetical protein
MWDHLPIEALLASGNGERMMKTLPNSSGPYMVTAGIKTAHGWCALQGELCRLWSRN